MLSSEQFWDELTFWLFLTSLVLDVCVAVVAIVIVHCKKLSQSTKLKLEKIMEWSAGFAAILALSAILSEYKFEKIQSDNFNKQIQLLKNSKPRSLTLAQQMFLGRSVGWMTNKPEIKINATLDADDGETLANQFEKVFTEAGFKINSVTLGVIGGLPSNHGIFVFGQTNEMTTSIVRELNHYGLLATNINNSFFTNEIFIDIEAR
jgi:hypothetical protein